MPDLHTLVVADRPEAWMAAGFDVDIDVETGDGHFRIGGIRFRLTGANAAASSGPRRGIVACVFDGVDDGSVDGITMLSSTGFSDPPALGDARPASNSRVLRDHHPNGAVHLDHVVMFTPDLDRTVQALRLHDFEPRRFRNVPGSDPAKKQIFFWAGETIIELLGPVEPTGTQPASLWGLAINVDDLDASVAHLGGALGSPKPAVQPGRRIATVRTKELGIGTAIAFMSAHVQPDGSPTHDA